YVHGLFESAAACDALLLWAGLRGPESPDYQRHREAEIDRLADAIERHLDVGAIEDLLRSAIEGSAR
ncbi:MAG: cobyric acid synthase CobQ, partial [Pseudomonadota bacterium]|nr:cobyric acid synthase CobQ [Pseudomonadota bacterium]